MSAIIVVEKRYLPPAGAVLANGEREISGSVIPFFKQIQKQLRNVPVTKAAPSGKLSCCLAYTIRGTSG